MKGLFNKALVIALLVSVCGVRAQVTDMSGKQLFVAAAAQLSKEAKDAVVVGYNAVKNSDFVSSVAQGASQAKDAALAGLNVAKNSEVGREVVKGLSAAGTAYKNLAVKAVELSKPVLVQQKEALKHVAGTISTTVKNGSLKVAELSKPAFVAALGYAVRAKDGAKSFYANHTEGCIEAAAITTYVGVCILMGYLRYRQIKQEKQEQEVRDREAAQAHQVTEATQVDVNELNNQGIVYC